jgi:hypothetical protein
MKNKTRVLLLKKNKTKTYLGLLYIKLKCGVFTVYKNIVHPLIFYYELQ